MFLLQCIIRGILLGIPLGIAVLGMFQESGNFAPLYFASKPEYHQFLEDLEKGGQAKAKVERFFSWDREDHQWYLKDSLNLSRLIALRVDAEHWSEDKIRDLSQYVLIMSYRHKLPTALVLAVIEVESHYRTHAVSPRGAVGLMQVMPATAEEIALRAGLDWKGEKSLRDPKRNIEIGIHYLVELRRRFKKPEHMLTAYNMGPYALERLLRSGAKPSYGYYNKVMSTMRVYKEQSKAPVTAAAAWAGRWL
jgi:soluble lytic murein transglycosylase-like protein